MSLDELISAGFAPVAEWWRDADGVAKCKDHNVPRESGVYLFVLGGRVQYVGAALKSLGGRMRSYERRQRAPRSTRPVHKKLADAIAGGERVEVYARSIASSEVCAWRGLPVNVPLGVEAALVAAIDPPWNRRGRTHVADTENEDDEDEKVVG